MRVSERNLNIFEHTAKVIAATDETGLRKVEFIYMTDEEFAEFYLIAMNQLPTNEAMALHGGKVFKGAKIIIEEVSKKKTKQ